MTYIDDQDAMRLIIDAYRAITGIGWTPERRHAFRGFVQAIWFCLPTSSDLWLRLGRMVEATIDAAYTVRDEA